MDVIANKLNLTYDSHMSADWGVLPKSGPFNASGEWGGIMGDVITGVNSIQFIPAATESNLSVCQVYDISLSSWAWTVERNDLLDFLGVSPRKMVLLWTPNNPETDFELFTRPFTNESWTAILIITGGRGYKEYFLRPQRLLTTS